MQSKASSLPIVDFSAWSLDIEDEKEADTEDLPQLAGKIHRAFCSLGFVYIINHGIKQQLVDEVNEVSRKFFSKPLGIKSQYARPGSENNHGWVELESETLNPDRPGDLKEAFNITPWAKKAVWPDEVVPGFQKTMMEFFKSCHNLSQRVLQLMAMGLGLQDTKFFSRKHNPYTKESYTTLRCLHYPPLPASIQPGQVRCGEHSDYGSITLLFQDDVGGLEVRKRGGDYMAAVPVPGAVLINVGDLMMRWTSDTLVSTKHRVLIPEDEIGKGQTRQSLAFFVHPDDEEMIECVGDVTKYKPIQSKQYTKWRLDVTY